MLEMLFQSFKFEKFPGGPSPGSPSCYVDLANFLVKMLDPPLVSKLFNISVEWPEFAIGTYLSVYYVEQKLVEHVHIELSFLLCEFLA